MDAHPIPQNVTSFQFRLVGDMTLKQFLYLASGMSIAYLNFVFVASYLPIIAWPVIILSALLGIAFAFLPIADRPLDHWLGAFLKAIYSPTKRVWIKKGKHYDQDPNFIKRLDLYKFKAGFAQSIPQVAPVAIPKIQPVSQSIPVPLPQKPPPAQEEKTPTPQEHTPQEATPEELSQTVELAKQAQNLQMQIVGTQKQLDAMKTSNSVEGINQILTHLQQLMNDASSVKRQLVTVTHEAPTPQATTKVEVVTLPKTKPTQIVLTSTANVINGIITDTAGNYLDGVVVVIYDKDGLPVRALKTNKLGQFSGATPLPNGKYTIQLEKDSLSFDVLQITLSGLILPPIMISAKKLL